MAEKYSFMCSYLCLEFIAWAKASMLLRPIFECHLFMLASFIVIVDLFKFPAQWM
jgi:hypothetical protein